MAAGPMRFLTYDELTPSMEVDRTLIHLASFGGAWSRRSIEIWRRRSRMLADYVGVFAVERGRLLGQTFVLRIPYTFSEGVETVTGIAAVGTRPDRGRAGVARAILTEIHRREKEAGVRFSTLWTNRSWGAHRLYEALGYRDVYSSPWAVHAPSQRSLKRREGIHMARATDLTEIEQLHRRITEGRTGFLRSEPGTSPPRSQPTSSTPLRNWWCFARGPGWSAMLRSIPARNGPSVVRWSPLRRRGARR